MFNLIKNELYKIFHKKSTIIVLIIMFLYVLLINFVIYRVDVNQMITHNAESKEYIAFCLNNESDKEEYARCLALDDTYKKMGNYYDDSSSWQYAAYMEGYAAVATNYNIQKIVNNNDDQRLKAELDDIVNKINNGDWQYFVNKRIDSLKTQLNEIKNELNEKQNSKKIVDDMNAQIFNLEENIKLNEYRLKENIPNKNDYLNDAISMISNNSYDIYNYNNGKENNNYTQNMVKEYYVNKYILENKQDLNNEKTVRMFLINLFSNFDFMIMVFILIIAGSIVSEEFNKGTIKSLLVLPYKRSTILLSKYIATIISVLLGIIFMYLIELLIGGLFFGFNSLTIPYVTYNISTKSIEVISLFKYCLINTLVKLPRLILYATLAFSLSTIICNTAFAIAITFCGNIGEGIIQMIYHSYHYKLLNYFVVNNWDFSEFLFGGKSSAGVSLVHAIIVCLVYLFIMLIVSLIVFKKRDIKNI